jgi:hypothetical protein
MDNSDMNLSEIRELISDTVRQLGLFRSEAAQSKNEQNAMLKQLKESERWQTHDAIYKESKERIAELESGLRKLAVEYYKRTGEKRAHQAAEVKIMTRLEYDREKAKEWALENWAEALELNDDVFEEYAMSVRHIKPLTFVTFKEEPKLFIKRDLSPYMSEF